MASISSLIVAQNQNAAPSSGKARHGGKQHQHGAISFGALLSQTLVNVEEPPEKAGTNTSAAKKTAKSTKVDAHRIKAPAHKDQSEAGAAVLAAAPLNAGAAVVAVTPRDAGTTGDKRASAAARETGLDAIVGTTRSEKLQADKALAAAETGTASDTDAADTASAAQSAPVDDILHAVRAAVSRAENSRAAPLAGNSAAIKSDTARTVGRTEPSSDAAAASQTRHAVTSTVAQIDGEKQELAKGIAPTYRALEGAGVAQGSGEANTSKSVTAAAADNLKLAPTAFSTVSQQSIEAAPSADVPEVAKQAVAPRVASEEWGNALGKQMVWMANANQQLAELHLNPPDLGPLTVKLVMNQNQAQAMFASPHQSVLAAVEAALPQLRTALAESGISLGNTSLGPNGQHQGMLAQNQSGQSDQPRQHGHREDNAGFSHVMDGTDTPAAPAVPVTIRNNGGAIDTFV
jgi:flagellar hook-length control protein FliK